MNPIIDSAPAARPPPACRRPHTLVLSGLVLLLVLLPPLSACSRDDAAATTALAIVDTLPGGAVRVRNSPIGVWDVEPSRRWRLVEEVRIGRTEGEGPDVFGSIGSMVEDPLGRVWIVDPMAAEVRVFNARGAHVRTVGGKGSGPGEFQRPAVMLTGPDGNIWIDDTRMRRWEVFDTAGNRVAGHRTNSNVGGGVRAWTDDGRLLEVNAHSVPGGDRFAMRANLAVRRLNADGTFSPEDSLDAPVLPEGERVHFVGSGERQYTVIRRLPLAHHPRSLLARNGDYWIGDGGGSYTIRREKAGGDTLLIIEREYEPIPASDDVLALAAEELLPPENMTSSDNDRSRLPDVRPPFEDYFAATDGTLWVRRAFAADSVGFDVFAADGRYLGMPESSVDVTDLRIALVTPERIYAVARDELDVESVLVLRIERP
jgi:hypothetical protein